MDDGILVHEEELWHFMYPDICLLISPLMFNRPAAPHGLEFGPDSLIMWVTVVVLLLLCLPFTCFQVDLTGKRFVSGEFLLFPTGSCVGLRSSFSLQQALLQKVPCEPVLFLHCTGSSKKMATLSMLEEKREEVQRKQTSKACRKHSKAEGGREGGSWRKGLRRFNRGELKLRHN